MMSILKISPLLHNLHAFMTAAYPDFWGPMSCYSSAARSMYLDYITGYDF